MDYITGEFVNLRMGEPLEERLGKIGDFWKKQRQLADLLEQLQNREDRTEEHQKKLEEWESLNTEHSYLYSREA